MSKINMNKVLRDFTSWLFMIPGIILFTLYVWNPLLSGLRYSFYQTKGLKMIKFVGLDNYIRVLGDNNFQDALVNTLKYTFWSLVIGYGVPILIGMFLNEMIHLKGFFKLGIYFPNIVPALATFLMWDILMSPAQGGVLNSFLTTLGFPVSAWMQNPKLGIPLIVFTMTWRSFGSTVLIYMASLQSINQELYEAAAVDGAGIRVKIRHITIPSILPLARMLLLLQIISVFQVMQEPFIMTDGGPSNATLSLLLLNYRYLFVYGRLDLAATVGGLVSIILFVMSFVYLRITKNKEAV